MNKESKKNKTRLRVLVQIVRFLSEKIKEVTRSFVEQTMKEAGFFSHFLAKTDSFSSLEARLLEFACIVHTKFKSLLG